MSANKANQALADLAAIYRPLLNATANNPLGAFAQTALSIPLSETAPSLEPDGEFRYEVSDIVRPTMASVRASGLPSSYCSNKVVRQVHPKNSFLVRLSGSDVWWHSAELRKVEASRTNFADERLGVPFETWQEDPVETSVFYSIAEERLERAAELRGTGRPSKASYELALVAEVIKLVREHDAHGIAEHGVAAALMRQQSNTQKNKAWQNITPMPPPENTPLNNWDKYLGLSPTGRTSMSQPNMPNMNAFLNYAKSDAETTAKMYGHQGARRVDHGK